MSINTNNNDIDALFAPLISTFSKSSLNKEPMELSSAASVFNNPIYESKPPNSQEKNASDSEPEKGQPKNSEASSNPNSQEKNASDSEPEKGQPKSGRGRASPKKRLHKKSEASSNNNNNSVEKGTNDNDDDDSSIASDSEEEQIPKKKIKMSNFEQAEAEESSGAEELVLSDFDEEEQKKKPKPKWKKQCQTRHCVLQAVKYKQFCSNCGRSRREKKARALRMEARRLEEEEYELHHKIQRNVIREKQAAQRLSLDKKREAIKRRFVKA